MGGASLRGGGPGAILASEGGGSGGGAYIFGATVSDLSDAEHGRCGGPEGGRY
jgi:hypothetical protein